MKAVEAPVVHTYGGCDRKLAWLLLARRLCLGVGDDLDFGARIVVACCGAMD